MTLTDIVTGALQQLGRSSDRQTMDTWEKQLTAYANEAVMDIAKTVGLHRSEPVEVADGEIDLSALERSCIKVISVKQNGEHVFFRAGSATNKIAVLAEGPVVVDYRYKPQDLSNSTDKPEVPLHTHSIIVTYVVARERMSQDVSTQGGANPYFEMYHSKLNALRSNSGEPDKYKITNKW